MLCLRKTVHVCTVLPFPRELYAGRRALAHHRVHTCALTALLGTRRDAHPQSTAAHLKCRHHCTESASPEPLPLWKVYLGLAKYRLGSLVCASTMIGYWMAPSVFVLSDFVCCTVGTALAIASANTFNQVIEEKNDARMRRTARRTLPLGHVSRTHAITFGVLTGLSGVALLYGMVNPVAAALAGGNIVLYAGVYTPMKQMHPVNTWVGGIVGAIPPAIGWASAASFIAHPSLSLPVAFVDPAFAAAMPLDPACLVLPTILFLWQIPHFMALSWPLRHDYERGGFKMLSNVNPAKVPVVTLRYAIYMLPIGVLAAATDLTTWWFALDSLIPQGHLLYTAYQFYSAPNAQTARACFFSTIFGLPLLFFLLLLHKKDRLREGGVVEEGEGEDMGKGETEVQPAS